MATAIVSGRVDTAIKERAGAYIRAAGLTVGDVINIVWESIASTGSLPHMEQAAPDEPASAWDAFMAFREATDSPTSDPIPDMTNRELHEWLGAQRLHDYEAL